MSTFERFVLIDDNEADNVFHEIMIRRACHTGEIIVFESGIDALEWFKTADRNIKTCVFLDINMPMMDGFEVAESVAPMLEDSQTVVLVMLTSSDAPADRERALKIPVISSFVTKPLSVALVKELQQ